MKTQQLAKLPNTFDLFWLSALITFMVVFFAVSNEENWPSVLPMATVVFGTMFFLWILWVREGTIPFFEIGVIYVAVVVVYTLYPMIGFIVNGLTYTPSNDYRLFSSRPTPNVPYRLKWAPSSRSSSTMTSGASGL